MDFLTAIQIRAARAVLQPDNEAVLRSIYRWYSSTFATPLHKVEDLPLEDVLLHYFEHCFEQLEHDDLIEKAQELVLDPEELKQEQIKAEAEDEEFFRKISAKAAEIQAKITNANKGKEDQIPAFKKKMEEFKSLAEKHVKAPEPELVIEYAEPNLNELNEGFGPPPKKR